MPDYPENPGPLPAIDLKNKSDGGKGPLDRPNFCSKDPELVKQLQKMLVTLDYDLGTYGPDKDGVDGAFGKLTETAVNDLNRYTPQLCCGWVRRRRALKHKRER